MAKGKMKTTKKSAAKKSTRAKTKKLSPAEELEALRAAARRLHEAEDLEAIARKAESRYLESREQTKSLKKEFESAAEKVRKTIREKTGLLPFVPAPEPAATKANSSNAGAPTGSDDPKLGSDDENAAREQRAFNAASLSDIGIVGKQAETLEADGIRTGKDLQAWFAGHPQRKISGIGEKAVEKIGELMAKWYENRKRAEPRGPLGDNPAPDIDAKKARNELRSAVEESLKAAKIDNSRAHRVKMIARLADIPEDKIERFAETASGETLNKWRDTLAGLTIEDVTAIFVESGEPVAAGAGA